MWVTQTYLGDVERDAKFFVYYFYEDYNSEQEEITESIQRHLEELGEVYGDQVSLMMPNPNYAGRIEAEVREFRELWMAVRGMLPGLLLSPVPLIKLRRSHDECKFVPLKGGGPKLLANVVRSVRQVADDAIDSAIAESSAKPAWLDKFRDAVEIKPGIWGVSIDLKRLAE